MFSPAVLVRLKITLMSSFERIDLSFFSLASLCSSSSPVSILHIYTAKGLREYAYAAAERLRDLDKLDAKEHKGKVARSACERALKGPYAKSHRICRHEVGDRTNCYQTTIITRRLNTRNNMFLMTFYSPSFCG